MPGTDPQFTPSSFLASLGLAIVLLGSTACDRGDTCPPQVETPAAASDPTPPQPVAELTAWNDTDHRKAIEAFVADVTDPNGQHFVPPDERIAVFDNDGTLWVELPVYTQLLFAMDRIRELASEHPDWEKQAPYSAIIANDQAAIAKFETADLMKIIAASHGGVSSEAFAEAVRTWLGQARHPSLDRPYDELTYAPMVELLAYLRAHGFRTYIVSGGGIDFMRVFAEEVYGVPPEQVIGSSIVTKYDAASRSIVHGDAIFFIDDGPGKPEAIDRHIGRRPILAVGNSDGDFQMLEYATSGPGKRLGIIVHHTDDEREFAYDRESHVGHLERGLDAAGERGWLVVDMKSDWARVFD